MNRRIIFILLYTLLFAATLLLSNVDHYILRYITMTIPMIGLSALCLLVGALGIEDK